MQDYRLEVGLEFIEHMRRTVSAGFPGEAVMAVPRTDGGILLMTKEFYPREVYRLPSGKMRTDEDPEEALHRELYEETSFRLAIDARPGRLDYTFLFGGRTVSFLSHVYVLQPTDDAPHPLDMDEQIADFTYATVAELRVVADRLRKLEHPWRDWGRFRAIAHDYVADALSRA